MTIFLAKKRQSGVVLVIGLIMLLLMTLIGVTAMQVTGLEEKMAGNNRNVILAFQASEASLRDAEAYLLAIVTATDFDDTNEGLLSEVAAEPDYLTTASWAEDSSVEFSNVLPVVKSNPRYIIKYVAEQADENSQNVSLNLGGYGESQPGTTITIFKVTSRGTGGTDNAQAILQTHYGKRF